MNKISAVTVFQTAVGTRMSMVYSEVDETGKITKSNSRVDRLIMNENDLEAANVLLASAQTFIDSQEA